MYDLTDVQALADLALSLNLITKFNYYQENYEHELFPELRTNVYIDDLGYKDYGLDITEAYWYLRGVLAGHNTTINNSNKNV